MFLFNNWCEDSDDDSGNDYYYDYDDCDIEKTVYDTGSDDSCQHGEFTNIPKVNELSKYSDSTKYRPCCEIESKMKHGYLHKDQCEVNIVNHFNNLIQIY